MNSPRLLNYKDLESAYTEVVIDGVTYAIDILTFVQHFEHGHRASISIYRDSYEKLISLLGGVGSDGLNHMSKEWELTMTIRYMGIPLIRAERWSKVRIVEEGSSMCTVPSYNTRGPHTITCMSTVITIEAMKVILLPTPKII